MHRIACKIQSKKYFLKQFLDDCGSILEATNYTQNFTSPDYPNNYPNDLNCVWNITARPEYFIHIVFIDFETESLYDQVSVSILWLNVILISYRHSKNHSLTVIPRAYERGTGGDNDPGVYGV